jgi:hypothetical protein
VICHGSWVGPKSGSVRGRCSFEVTEAGAHQTKSMPSLCMVRVAAQTLDETRLGKL